MLNYIWLALIVIGILVAVGSDWRDISNNKYHNDEAISAQIVLAESTVFPLQSGLQYSVTVIIIPAAYEKAYSEVIPDTVVQVAEYLPSGIGVGALHIAPDEQTPSVWKNVFDAQRNKEYLLAHVRWGTQRDDTLYARLELDPVKFVKLNAVTNDGIIRYAKTAVELAIGLIGIMALWLGIMKIAEQSGLVAKLAGALRPIMTRLFPDVPGDHPAMGAMIMNISANMLGLANAATPLGLKAMEELNKLNRKLGTATDAMCTFLVINTSNVQLIPATVIAIRAAAGSSNPTEILGPVIVATTINTIVGVVTVKFLSKLPLYKKALSDER